MNLKLSGLVLAISAALTLDLPTRAQAHEGHAHVSPGQSFEDASRPDGRVSSIGGGEHVGNMVKDKRRGDQRQETPPIPEPESYAMMLAGLGILVAVMRRRRQK
jgi:hypothetical protein